MDRKWLTEGAFVLNLDYRPDKWRWMRQHLRAIGITNFMRFSGVNGQELSPEEISSYIAKRKDKRSLRLNAGRLGTAHTHVGAIRLAYELGRDHVFILEDDAIFHPQFWERWDALEVPDDWERLHICAHPEGKWTQVSSGLIHATKLYAAVAYLVRRPQMVALMEHMADWPGDFDNEWNRVQNERVYCCLPNLAGHLPSISDNTFQIQYNRHLWTHTDFVPADVLKEAGDEHT